jgi:2,5-dihydroxypyridine 5,6-dioxygenase
MSNRRMMMNPAAAPELLGLFKHQLTMSNLKPAELCLVVTDTAYNPVYAQACLGAALDLGAEVYQITLPFSKPVSERLLGSPLLEADLMVYMTTHTLHYTEAMHRGLEHGLRALMAVQPLQTMERLKGSRIVVHRARAGAVLLRDADTIHITSEAGTDLTMRRSGRPALANYGLADERGHLDFWGGGMVQTAQLEGTTEGTLVLNTGDQIFYLARYIESPVHITFREGRAVKIEGGLDAFLLRKLLEDHHDDRVWMAGHMAWGVDRRASWAAQVVQSPESGSSAADAESYYGNVQIELGSNNDVAFQGKNAAPAHLGMCMLGCNLYLDDKQIIDRGSFVPEELK